MAREGKFVADPYRGTIPTGTPRPIIDTQVNKENLSSSAPEEIFRGKGDKFPATYGTGDK